MTNFFNSTTARNQAFNNMKEAFGEEYYALRKSAASVILHGHMKDIRKTRNGEFKVGMKCLDCPELFIFDGHQEFTLQCKGLESYFTHGHIATNLSEYQLQDAMREAFKYINMFLMQFN